MAEQGFKLVIGADGSQVTKTIGELQRQLKSFESGLKSTTSVESFTRLNRAITETKNRIEATSRILSSGGGFAKIKPGADQAGNALMNLSRVAQDAPFGFIGIANNLNPLLESFQRLGQSAGGLKGAMSALGSSLMGAGGIGLALSAFQFVALGGVDTLKKFLGFTDKTKEATEKAAEATKKWAEAQRENAESLAKQLITVESLVKVARSDASTKREQTAALIELNKIIPDSIGKLDALNIKTAAGTTIVKQYTDALIAQARAQLFTQKAVGIEGERFDEREKFVANQEALSQRLVRAQKQLADINKKSNAVTGLVTSGNAGVSGTALRSLDLVEEIDKVNTEMKEAEDNYLASRIASNKALSKAKAEIDKTFAKGVVIDAGGTDKKLKAPKIDEKSIDDLFKANARIKELLNFDALGTLTRSEQVELRDLKFSILADPKNAKIVGLSSGDLQRIFDEQHSSVDTVSLKMKIAIDPNLEDSQGRRAIDSLQATLNKPLTLPPVTPTVTPIDNMQERVQRLSDTLNNTLAPAFAQVFEGIANGGQNALQALGQAIKQIITKLISAAITAAIFAAIITAVTGGAGAGFGANFSKQFAGLGGFKIPGLATGGITRGPMTALIGEAGPEAVIPLAQLPRMVGMMTGNTGTQAFIADTRIDGNDIAISYRRTVGRHGNTFGNG